MSGMSGGRVRSYGDGVKRKHSGVCEAGGVISNQGAGGGVGVVDEEEASFQKGMEFICKTNKEVDEKHDAAWKKCSAETDAFWEEYHAAKAEVDSVKEKAIKENTAAVEQAKKSEAESDDANAKYALKKSLFEKATTTMMDARAKIDTTHDAAKIVEEAARIAGLVNPPPGNDSLKTITDARDASWAKFHAAREATKEAMVEFGYAQEECEGSHKMAQLAWKVFLAHKDVMTAVDEKGKAKIESAILKSLSAKKFAKQNSEIAKAQAEAECYEASTHAKEDVIKHHPVMVQYDLDNLIVGMKRSSGSSARSAKRAALE